MSDRARGDNSGDGCKYNVEDHGGGRLTLTIDCMGSGKEQLANERSLSVVNNAFRDSPNRAELAGETRSAVLKSLDGKIDGPLAVLQGNQSQTDEKSSAYVAAMKAAGVYVERQPASGGVESLKFPIANPPGMRNIMHPGSIVVQKDGQMYHESAQADRTRRSLTREDAQRMFSNTVSNSIAGLK